MRSAPARRRPLAALRGAALGLATTATLGGCLGDFHLTTDGGAHDGGRSVGMDGGVGQSGDPLRAQFEQSVWPILSSSCSACHDKEGGAGPAFLKPDPYDSLVAWPNVVVADAHVSVLLTKGQHAGPALTAAQASAILPWLEAEAATIAPTMGGTSLATPAARPRVGHNVVALDAVDAQLAGATIEFDASYVGNAITLDNLTLHAGAAMGVRIVHPLFIVWSAGNKAPDPVDSFATLDETVDAGQSADIGPGTLILNHVGTLDELSIAFASAMAVGAAADGGSDDGGVVVGGGGCNAVPAFTADAVPTLASRCVSCHGGNNAAAQAAVDMSDVNNMGAQATACAQVKTKINPASPTMSLILSVTDPKGNANHPFKFPDSTSFGAWAQAATKWISQEK